MSTSSDVDDRREFKRFPVEEQGFLISHEQNGEVYPVRINDVSARGIGFIANRYFTTEQKFSIQYSILNHDFHLPVKVMWIQQIKEGVQVGCKKQSLQNSYRFAG